MAIIITSEILYTQGLVCYTCKNVPHPRDCGRIVECSSGEDCYVEQIVTTSGNILYNSGCASRAKCSLKRKRTIPSDDITSLVKSQNKYLQKRDDVALCYECCNSTSYCNRDSCDSSGSSAFFVNRTSCLSCPNAESPDKCEFVTLCDVNEICYTELVRINGEDRYRLGCVDPTACFMTDDTMVPALVGKKRFLVPQTRISSYCGKCCNDRVSNCNRDLCRSGVTDKPDTIGILKNPPPQQICEDIDTQICAEQIRTDPDSCLNVTIANYVCRRSCKGCSSGSLSPGQGIIENLPMTDCFYDSTKYQGARRTSISRRNCINWSLVYGNVPPGPGFPETDFRDAENKCRDPTGKGHPWCYINEQTWEFCNVPFCEECYFKDNENKFNGYTSKTPNATCSPWESYTGPIPLTDDMFPDGSLRNASNYCREIDSDIGIRCYVNGQGFEPCGIQECTDPCADDVNTNCDLIKQFVCAREYSGRTLCPKTCGHCGVGLRPSKYIPPPTQICEDNAKANCPLIKDVICMNLTAARDVCPVTCNIGCVSYCSVGGICCADEDFDISLGPVLPVTTRPTVDKWSVWSPWTCQRASSTGNCFQVRYRACSSGREADCQGKHTDIQACDPVTCPGSATIRTTASTSPKTTPTTKATTTVNLDPCRDSATCSAINGVTCSDTVIADWLCPKTCGFCGNGNCKDVFDCSIPGVRDYFCSDTIMGAKFCRKSCGNCAGPFMPIKVNECGDPVDRGVCTLLNKELCICHDPDIKMLCKHYCDNVCPNEVFKDYSYCNNMAGKRSTSRSQRIKDFLYFVRFV